MVKSDLQGSLNSEGEESLGSTLIVMVRIQMACNCMEKSMLVFFTQNTVCILVKVYVFSQVSWHLNTWYVLKWKTS